MSTGNRTRLEAPGWRLDEAGNFTLDLSWTDDDHRWLEVRPDPSIPNYWRLVLWEASDDSSSACHEVLAEGAHDPTVLLISIEADPFRFDRRPNPAPTTDEDPS